MISLFFFISNKNISALVNEYFDYGNIFEKYATSEMWIVFWKGK